MKFLILEVDKFLILQTLLTVAVAEKASLDLVNRRRTLVWFGKSSK
jgi:hypothetical protein